MPFNTNIHSLLRDADDLIWRGIFGSESYMRLHPPLRLRLRIAARFPLCWVSPRHNRRPIFVVGCPRSGTTLLFNTLRQSPALSSLRQESHWVWEFLHPPEHRDDHSQVLRAGDLTARSERFIRTCYGAAFGRNRFVDKCPTNALHIEAIKRVFPDAKIVCLMRNGPDNVSSLIDTWLDPDRFVGFDVPEELDISGYGRQKWVHLLPPGWQRYSQRTIEEVCAHQWRAINEDLRGAKEEVADEDWIIVRMPEKTLKRLYEKLGLAVTEEVASYVDSLNENVVNTASQPGAGKWRRRNPERVSRIRPMIAPTMEKIGYDAAIEGKN